MCDDNDDDDDDNDDESNVDEGVEKYRRLPILHCCVPVDMINELE
jgi:hypothetical protein